MMKYVQLKDDFDPDTTCGLCGGPLNEDGDWTILEDAITITRQMADAICDMDDIAYSEGLGPETAERTEAWDALVAAAERLVCRVVRRHRTRT